MIYFIQNTRSKDIKIGKSDNVEARLKQLQTGHADRLVLLGSVFGGLPEESRLHMRFHAWRKSGEWFDAEIFEEVREILCPAKHTRFYLAGKITKNGWRGDILGFQPNADQGEEGDWQEEVPKSWPERAIWPETQMARNGLVWQDIDYRYVGPYFVSSDSIFQGHGSAHGRSIHAYPDLDTSSGDLLAPSPDVAALCLGAIRKANIVFAWIDTDDCHGTIAELGYAKALDKQILIAGPRLIRDLWFVYHLADRVMVVSSPVEAFVSMVFYGLGTHIDRFRGVGGPNSRFRKTHNDPFVEPNEMESSVSFADTSFDEMSF